MRKKSSKTVPSPEEVKRKRPAFVAAVDERLRAGKRSRTPVQDFLASVSDQLLRFRGTDLPYSDIRRVVNEAFRSSVSEHAVRRYCQEHLGFPKGGRGKQAAEPEPRVEIEPEAAAVLADDPWEDIPPYE